MPSHPYIETLGALSDSQCRVVARSQLNAIGVPHNTVSARCRVGGPWQQPLPKVVVLQSGPLSVEQRCWAALCYAAARPLAEGSPLAREALLTAEPALAVHGLTQVPHLSALPAIEVLVPHRCSVRSHAWVRISRTRRMPGAVWVEAEDTRLPVVPVGRALVDAIRGSTDAEYVRRLVLRTLRVRGPGLDELARELRSARLSRRADVASVLEELRAGVRSTAEGDARLLIARAGLPQPVWHAVLTLDGAWLGAPDAYWPLHGVALEVDDAHAAQRRHRLEGTGLYVIHASPWQIRHAARELLSLLRTALAGGPYAPADRIAVIRR
jgi:hypothetical protein